MDSKITLRNAELKDLKPVVSIFKNAIKVMDGNNIPQWDEIYPDEEILREDILNNEMFLGEIGDEVASIFVLNQQCDKEYEDGNWEYNGSNFYVIHRLCVNPAFQNKGVGTSTMLLIEEHLRQRGVEAIRLDAFSLNPFALKMYEKLGYKKAGEANWRKGLFYLYEKEINFI